MKSMDQLEWDLALLLNGRADCAYTHDWGMVRDYDQRIAQKEAEIGQRSLLIEGQALCLFGKALEKLSGRME